MTGHGHVTHAYAWCRLFTILLSDACLFRLRPEDVVLHLWCHAWASTVASSREHCTSPGLSPEFTYAHAGQLPRRLQLGKLAGMSPLQRLMIF